MIRTFRMEVLLWAEVGTFIVYQVTNSLVFLWRDVWDWGEWRWIWRDKYVVIKDSLLHYPKGYFWNPNPSLKISNARKKKIQWISACGGTGARTQNAPVHQSPSDTRVLSLHFLKASLIHLLIKALLSKFQKWYTSSPIAPRSRYIIGVLTTPIDCKSPWIEKQMGLVAKVI